jgi:hypothetical protein
LLNFALNRDALLYRKSKDGKKEFYIDAENASTIIDFLKSDPANLKKFKYVLELLLEHNRPPRDLYDKENFETGCEIVTAIKLFKGKKNPRIYCQQFAVKNKKVYVIVASELLEKKKSEKLTNKEKGLIRRVASYEYKLKDGK